MSNRILTVQSMAVNLLRFLVSLGNSKKFKEQYKVGWYDSMVFEYINGVLSINIQAGDSSIGYRTYISNMENNIEVLSLCDESGFEGMQMDYAGDAVAVAFNAIREFCENKECIVSTSLIRASKKEGSIEVRVRNFGSTFIKYSIAKKDRRSVLNIGSISATWDPTTSTSARSFVI